MKEGEGEGEGEGERVLKCLVDLDCEKEEMSMGIGSVHRFSEFGICGDIDSCMVINSDNYSGNNPLVIRGKGGGSEACVGGILKDLNRIAGVMDTFG